MATTEKKATVPLALQREYDPSTKYEYMFNIPKMVGAELKDVFAILKDKDSSITKFSIKKKDGGKREIIAPNGILKSMTKWMRTKIFNSYKASKIAYAYVKNRSIVDVAKHHVGALARIEIDLKSFFPNIKKKNVINCLYGNEYICKQCVFYTKHTDGYCSSNLYKNREWIKNKEFEKVTCPEVLYFYSKQWRENNPNFISFFEVVAELCTYDGALTQGYPTSPILSNIVFRGIDNKLIEFSEKHNIKISRYSDNIFASSDHLKKKELEKLVKPFIYKKIKNFGFIVNTSQYNAVSKHTRMSVLGVNIHEHPNINKVEYKRRRAELHRMTMDLQNEQIGDLTEFHKVNGWWVHFNHVNPKKGAKYLKILKEHRETLMSVKKYEYNPDDYKDYEGEIYWSDGGSRGNGRTDSIGGYGIVKIKEEESGYKKYIKIKTEKFCSPVTNNQMELAGVIQSVVKIIKAKEKKALIVTDSWYCVSCFNEYLPNWVNCNRFKKGSIKNYDMWKVLKDLTDKAIREGFEISILWTERDKEYGNRAADGQYNEHMNKKNTRSEELSERVKYWGKFS